MSCRDKAARLLNQGRVEDALRLLEADIPVAEFGARVSKRSDELFELIDLRCKCLLKLRRYNASKNDSDALIKLKPSTPTGYFRKAKIYSENGIHKKVAQTYRTCLKHLEKDSKYTDQVKQLIVKAEAYAKFRFADPVRSLPANVLVEIFEQAAPGIDKIVQLMLVCKSWNSFIGSESKFWTNLSFHGKTVCATTVHNAMNKCKNRPLKLSIQSNVLKRPVLVKTLCTLDNVVSLRLNTCVQLGELRGLRQPFLEDLQISTNQLAQDLIWALENLATLKTLELTHVGSTKGSELEHCNVSCPLESLSIYSSSPNACLSPKLAANIVAQCELNTIGLHHVLREMEPLKPLLLNEAVHSFGFTSLTTRSNLPLLEGPLTSPLRSLTLNRVKIQPILSSSLQLVYIEVKWSDLGAKSVSEFLDNLKCHNTLEVAVLHDTSGAPPNWQQSSSQPQFERLHTLQFTSMPVEINSHFVEWVETRMPSLKSINLNDCPIKGRFIARLIRHGIKVIKCREAFEVGIDLVQYAKVNGVTITFK